MHRLKLCDHNCFVATMDDPYGVSIDIIESVNHSFQLRLSQSRFLPNCPCESHGHHPQQLPT